MTSEPLDGQKRHSGAPSRMNPVERLAGLVEPDLSAVDTVLHARMNSDVPLIPQLGSHLVDSGG